MRPFLEIQRAHDVLAELIERAEGDTQDPSSGEALVIAALDALCWVLEHDKPGLGCNTAFGENLAKVERKFAEAGYVLKQKTSYVISDDGKSITCGLCGNRSTMPDDVADRHCPYCQILHEPPPVGS
jgi:hypothetical protein